MSTALGMTVTLLGRDAAGDDVGAQAFADGEDMVDLPDGAGFQSAREAVAQAALRGAAVVDGGIFPEGADFVDDRDSELARRL